MFSKSSLIPPRYLFADPSSQSMKAAAISELYLLNENTNGSSSFLARRQGRQQGVGMGVGVGGRWWCRIQLCPEKPGNHGEAERRRCWRASLPPGDGLSVLRAKPARKQLFQLLLPGAKLISCPYWKHPSSLVAKDERWCLPRMKGPAYDSEWPEELKLISFNFSLRSRISLETLANWRPNTKPLHLILLSTLKFLFPELTSSLQNFSQVGEFHSGKKNKIPFLPDNTMWLYTARAYKSVSPEPAPAYTGQVPLFWVGCDFQSSRYSGCRLLSDTLQVWKPLDSELSRSEHRTYRSSQCHLFPGWGPPCPPPLSSSLAQLRAKRLLLKIYPFSVGTEKPSYWGTWLSHAKPFCLSSLSSFR